MTKPAVLVNDTSRVMPQLAKTSMNVMRRSRGDADVMRLSSARPGLLAENRTAKTSVGIDDTAHSRDVSQKALKAIFETSKAGKPETDFLTDCKYKPIQYLGTRGIVPTKHLPKVPKGNRPGITNQEVTTKIADQFAVYSDFPKGPGGIEPNKLWQDGTYDTMLAQVTKEREALPEHISFLAPDTNARIREFNLAGQVGGTLFGDALHKQEIQKYFRKEQDAYERQKLRNMGKTDEEIERDMKTLELERDVVEVKRRFPTISERGALAIASSVPFDMAEYRRLVARGEEPRINVIREGHPDEEEDRRRAGVQTLNRARTVTQAPRRTTTPHNVRIPTAPVTGAGAGDGGLQNIRVIDGIRTMFLNL